jgi:hypothetical protein
VHKLVHKENLNKIYSRKPTFWAGVFIIDRFDNSTEVQIDVLLNQPCVKRTEVGVLVIYTEIFTIKYKLKPTEMGVLVVFTEIFTIKYNLKWREMGVLVIYTKIYS